MEENQNIPEGWDYKALIQLADYINGYAFKPTDWSKEGLPIIRIEQLKNSNAEFDYCNFKVPEKNIINKNDLIFSWSASLFLKLWDKEKAVLNQHLFKVIPFDSVNKYFLKYLLDYSIADLSKNAQGSTMQHIKRTELYSFYTKLPQSLPEQRQIAAILSKVDEAISQTEQLIAKYSRIKTGLMQDLLTKGIDQNGNIRSEQTHEFKDSPLGRIPKEWECNILGVGIKSIDAGKSLECPNIQAGYNQWGIIKVSAIKREGFVSTENKVLLSTNLINEDYKIKKNDFLISRANTIDLVGEVCIVENEINNLLLSDKSLRITFSNKTFNQNFIFYSLLQKSSRLQIEINATGSSASMKNISQEAIKNILIIYPKTMQEQNDIVVRIKKIEGLIKYERTKLSKLQSLKTGLMQDLLSGKVRVNKLIKENA